MKKSIFLFFAAILCAMSISAAGTTPNRLYMKRDWQTDNAWFAAYFFGNGEKWVKMTDLGNGLYTCETPQDKSYPNVIFCRMDGSKQNNLSWGAKWEQTADLTLSASKDFYKKTSWTTFAPTVAGDEVLLGENWNPGNTANKMTKQNNGTYTLVKEGITLEKKAYEYKVTDGSWDWSVGKNGNNASLSINPAGTYNVTFTYTPSSNTVSASATPIYTITASANPATAGTVTGTGKYAKDTPVTLEATPNAGYKFVNWTVGGAEKSTDATYSFTASADVTAVANFELSDPEVPTYTISVSANDDAMGTVTGAGDYTEGSPVTLTATPNAGYRFVNWTVGSEVKSTETTYSFTASETLTIVANFEAIPKYDITVKAVVPETWTNATIGIHYWGDGISGTSTPVATEKEGNWNKYTIKDVLEGQSVNVIFLNGTSWGSDKSKQTANITGITEDKCFQISAKTLDGEGKCTFTEVDCAADIKPEGDVYTVVGSSDELGLAWDPTKKANDMEKQDNGSYKKVYSNVELTTSVEWKIAKNGDWWNETPLENKAANGNSVLTISKSGIYNVTFTLSKDLKTAHAEAELLEETNTVADCFVSGNAALTGGAGWAGNEFKMEYDDATETYSYTLTELATDKAYELKIVLGGAWHSYADLASVPAGVTKGNDDAIAFKMAAAGDVVVTYNVEDGITLSGNFALPVTYDYYLTGTLVGGWSAKQQGMEKDGEFYKVTFTELNAGTYQFKITDGQFNTEEDKTHEHTTLAAEYKEVSYVDGNIQFVTEEAKNIIVIFDATANKITIDGLTIVTHTYTIAGDAALCGEAWNWELESNDMTNNGDGTYTWTKAGVEVNGELSFKVFVDHKSESAYPAENWVIKPENYEGNGVYDVTITFTESSKEIAVALTKQVVDPTIIDVTLSGMVKSQFSRLGRGYTALTDGNGNEFCIWNESADWAYGTYTVTGDIADYGVSVTGTGDWKEIDGVETLTATLQVEDDNTTIYNVTATVGVATTITLECYDATYTITDPEFNEVTFTGVADGKEFSILVSYFGGEYYSEGEWGETFIMGTEIEFDDSDPEAYYLGGTYIDDASNTYEVLIFGTPAVVEPTPNYTRTVTAGKFGTLCLPFGGEITGAVLYECVGSEPGKVYLGSVTTLVAGVPYIFQATATELAVYSDGTTAVTAGKSNGLHGTFDDETPVDAGNYILLNNELRLSDGTAKVNANRAYLVMDEVPADAPQQMPGRRYIGMSVQGENAATGLDNIATSENAVKVISNGQLIIIRGGEKFNAQGVRF